MSPRFKDCAPRRPVPDLPGELWKAIDEFPGYKVSNLGRVKRVVSRYGHPSVRLLCSWVDSGTGYLRVGLRHGLGVQQYVHWLVAAAFLGPCPDGYEIDHRDTDRSNSALSNLRYLPMPENRAQGNLRRTG